MSDVLHRTRFRLDHRWTPGHMSDFLDGELAPKGRVRVERHVRECVECRRLLADLHGMLDALHRLPAPAGEVNALQIAASVRLRLNEPAAPE
jgi:anti-sigma factor RsiW